MESTGELTALFGPQKGEIKGGKYTHIHTYIHTYIHNGYLEWPNVIDKLLNHCRDRV